MTDMKDRITGVIRSTLSVEFKSKVRMALAAPRTGKRIKNLLDSGDQIKLELGAGQERGLTGWTTVDANRLCYLTLDLTQKIPFPDETVDEIYSCHLLEHLSYPDPMNGLLAECRRILKPGARLRVAVPDASIFLKAYCNPEGFDDNRYCLYRSALHSGLPIDYVNYIAYMAGHHRHMFDEDNLVDVLKKAGFCRVKIRDFDLEIDPGERVDESIYAEGVK
jgi:predicted SAM-dependent methyltransferase